MSTQSQIDRPIADTRTGAPQIRLRGLLMLSVPVLISVVALYHLAACWNSPQPRPIRSQPHRIIHVIRAEHQMLPSTTGSLSDPSLVPDDERAFDPAAFPASWPYGAGWR
jgi:hypothetical protein